MDLIQYRGAIYRRADADGIEAATRLAESLWSGLQTFESAGIGAMRWTKSKPWPQRKQYPDVGRSNPLYFVFQGTPMSLRLKDRVVLTTKSVEWGILADEIHAAVEAIIRQHGFDYTAGMELNRLASTYVLNGTDSKVHTRLLDMNWPSATNVKIIVEAAD